MPGVRLPYRDVEYWESKGTMHFTDTERARYEAEEARYRGDHPACGSHRHSVSGSLIMHCGKCCPAPPLSPEQCEDIERMLTPPTPPQQLMKWRLRLYCGHVVEGTAHYTHKTLHAAFTGHGSCPMCGLDPAIIVDGEPVGLVEQSPSLGPDPGAVSRPATQPERGRTGG